MKIHSNLGPGKSLGHLVAILAFGFFQILSAGAGPIIARATGADEPEGRRQALGAALIGCTVMALVMALAGVETTRRAYAHAVATAYRFFSYGDAMLLRGVSEASR